MMKLHKTLYGLLAVLILLAGFTGCDRTTDEEDEALFPTDPDIFLDGFGSGVTFEAFSGTKVDAVQIDNDVSHDGSSSLRVTIPEEGDPAGTYAGGAFTHNIGRDLTGYNALTFWAKSSMDAKLNVVGFGNDNTGTSRFVAEMDSLELTNSWAFYIIPIPLSEKLGEERGLFYFAEGHESGLGYDIWFDEVQYMTIWTITDPRPQMATRTVNSALGDTVVVGGTAVIFEVDGVDQLVEAAPGYFSFTVSDEAILTVNEEGIITVVGEGVATVTAAMGDVDATGLLTVQVGVFPDGPATAAPVPEQDPADVISLFSNAYDNVTVDTWSTEWDMADVVDIQIAGDDVKLYSNLSYAGIEFSSSTIDASAMNHFSMDIWTPDPTESPAVFKIKLVDFGADGIYEGGDDTEHELTFTASTDPALQSETWVSLDVPLGAFIGLASTEHIAQLIISGDPNTVFVDNIYFFAGEVTEPVEPETPATAPAFPAADVISLFSDVYDDHPVDTWSPDWDVADVADVLIDADNVKLYTNLVYAVVDFSSETIDATTMTHFYFDFWTADPTDLPAIFNVKLVDFGADGAYQGGDDVEHELTFDANTTPALVTGNWVTFDIPLADFTDLITREHLAQLIISGDPNTVYLDNILFHN
jgi:hypothetical protein